MSYGPSVTKTGRGGPVLTLDLQATRRSTLRAMRIAIFSDVHANLPALEAVLADIEEAGVDARYALGDLVGYAPWPNEVLERLAAEGFPIVMGNYDDGTGFGRDECGCAYVKPTRQGRGRRRLRLDQGPHERGEQGLAADARIPRSASRPTASGISWSTAALAGSTSTSTRTSPTRRSRGSQPARTRTSSSAATRTRRTTRRSPGPGSSTSGPPASRRTATRAPAGRSSTRPPTPSSSAASRTTSRPPPGPSRRPSCPAEFAAQLREARGYR